MTVQKKRQSAVVKLGSARCLTKGSWGPYSDEQLMQPYPGLSKD